MMRAAAVRPAGRALAISFAMSFALSIGALAPAHAAVRGHKLSASKVKRAVQEALRDELDMLPGQVQSMKVAGLKPLAMPGPAAIVEVGFRQNEDFVGKVPVQVRVMWDGKLFSSIWVNADVRRTIPVVTAARRLTSGHVVTPADLAIRQMDVGRAPARALQIPADALGMEIRTPLSRGRPLSMSGLTAPNLVERGALVTLVAGGGALKVTARGRVEQAGPRNAVVRVTNLASKKVLHGRVVGPNHVLVSVN